jgi:hypothetical protein
MSQLLIDTLPMKFTVSLQEDSSGNKKYIARGRFALCDKPTANGRLYSRSLWEKQIDRLSEKIKKRRVLGELDHPTDGKTRLTRVSHLITSLSIEGDELIGETEILNTPHGRILQSLKEADVEVGVSSRGYGSTKPPIDGIIEVDEDDYVLDCFDFVADPATQTAYPKIFIEEREKELEKIPQDDVLTLDDLKENYQGLIEEIRVNEASEVEKIVKSQLLENFSKQLREITEDARKSAYEKALADVQELPQYNGAVNLLENIASMIHSFGLNADEQAIISEKQKELDELKIKVSEQEEKLQAASEEIDKIKSLAKKAAYTLHLERNTNNHPSVDTIRKLVGDVEQYSSIKEMDEKIQALLKEFKVDEVEKEESVSTEEIENELEETKKELTQVKENLKKSNKHLKQAVEICERYEALLFMEQKIVNHPRAKEIRESLSGKKVITESTVLRAIEEHPIYTPDNDEVDRIRAAVARGKQRSIQQDTFGKQETPGNGAGKPLLEEYGLSLTEFNKLASVTKAEH